MPNDASMNHSTTRYPAPRDFDDRIRRHYIGGGAYSGGSKAIFSHKQSLASSAKVVAILCTIMFAIFVLGVTLWVADTINDGHDEALPDANAQQMENPISDDATWSTPRSEWVKGTTPCLYQTDPEWSELSYADGTIGTHGCGPTALSMAYIALTGKTDMDPEEMGKFAEDNGFIDTGLTSWLLMSDGAKMLGLRSKELPASSVSLKNELQKGSKVICCVHKGDFTDEGHFIVLTRLNPDGTVEVRDPNSEDRTKACWDLDRIISQCDNIWALSA